jgi:NADH-quinone oxidoreductase subunit I
MIFDKTKLLSVFDVTRDAEPLRYGTPPKLAAPQTQTQVGGSTPP